MAIGEVYTLRRDVLLCRSNNDLDAVRDWLLPQGSEGTVEHPPPRTEFSRTWSPEAVRGVIPAGTRLSLTKILLQDSVTWAQVYYIFTLRDGASAGRKVCGNKLMTPETETAPAVPNDEYLQLAP